MKLWSRTMISGLMLLALIGSARAAVSVNRLTGFNKTWQFLNSGYEDIEPFPTGYYKDYNSDGIADFIICQKGSAGNLRLFTVNTAKSTTDKTYANKTAGRDFAASAGSSVPQRVFTPRSPKSDTADLVVYSNNSGGANGAKSDSLTFQRLNKTNTAWPTEKSWTLTMPFKSTWVVQWPEYSMDTDDYPDFFVYNSSAPDTNRRFVITLYNGLTGVQIWQKTLAADSADKLVQFSGFTVSTSNIIVYELPLLPVSRIGNGDFDDDGKPELFVFYTFGNMMTNAYTTCINVLNSSGNPLAPYTTTWTRIGPSGAPGAFLSATRADLDKDGYRDAVFVFPHQIMANEVSMPVFMAYSLKKRAGLFQSTNSEIAVDAEDRSEFNTMEPFSYGGNGAIDMSGDGKVDLMLFRDKSELGALQIGLFSGVGGHKIWMSSSSALSNYDRAHMLANDFNYDGIQDFALVKNPTGPTAPTWTIANTAFTKTGISLGKQLTYTSSVAGSALSGDQEYDANSTTIGAFGDMDGNGQRDTWASLWWETSLNNVAQRAASSLIVYNTPPPSNSAAASCHAGIDLLFTNEPSFCPAMTISYARTLNGYTYVDNDADKVKDDVVIYCDQALFALNFKSAGSYPAAGQPTTPTPVNGGSVQVNHPLRWEAPDGDYENNSFDVYLGTSQSAVTNATRASAEYKGNIGFTAIYLPRPALTAGKTYYWRVDSINPWGQATKGATWRLGAVQPTAAKNAVSGENWAIYR